MSKIDREIVGKWDQLVGNAGFPSWMIRHAAVLLDNQYQWNASQSGPPNAKSTDDSYGDACRAYEGWKRLSVPTILRTLKNEFLGHRWVSFQSMLGPTGKVGHLDLNGQLNEVPMAAKTRRLKARFSHNWDQKTHPIALDYEAELSLLYAHEIGQELNREIIRDLRYITSRPTSLRLFGNRHRLYDLIRKGSDEVGNRTNGNDANWIICGPSVSEDIAGLKGFTPASRHHEDVVVPSVALAGNLDGCWDVYEDAFMPSHELVLGHKDQRHNEAAGYIFAPYIFLTYYPLHYNLATGNHQHDWTTIRYMKKLVGNLDEYYCSIFLED